MTISQQLQNFCQQHGYHLELNPWCDPDDETDDIYDLKVLGLGGKGTSDPTQDIKDGKFLIGQSCDISLSGVKRFEAPYNPLYTQTLTDIFGEDWLTVQKRSIGGDYYLKPYCVSYKLKDGGIAKITDKTSSSFVEIFADREDYEKHQAECRKLDKDPETGKYKK